MAANIILGALAVLIVFSAVTWAYTFGWFE
jgi:hypothetical protein